MLIKSNLINCSKTLVNVEKEKKNHKMDEKIVEGNELPFASKIPGSCGTSDHAFERILQ